MFYSFDPPDYIQVPKDRVLGGGGCSIDRPVGVAANWINKQHFDPWTENEVFES